MMVWTQHAAKHYRWNTETFNAIASSGTPLQYALSLLSIIIGVIMLRGSNTAWKYVLFLLGCHIATQVGSIGHDIRENWLWGLFFLVNVSAFIFIADQLVFKAKPPVVKAVKPVATPLQPTTLHLVKTEVPVKPFESLTPVVIEKAHPSFPTLYTKKKTLIQFEGFGTWAQLISVSSHKIHVKCIGAAPADFLSRKVEINFRNGLILNTWLDQKSDQDFYFEYAPLNESQIALLDLWVKKYAA
ncbi:MAG: hypothetical protein H7328_03505 [Bdellovibrio sp.]|nr:hypothetical protein [Bdellovibrio sp.]